MRASAALRALRLAPRPLVYAAAAVAVTALGIGACAGGDAGGGSGGVVSRGGDDLGFSSRGEGTYYAADGSGNCSFDPSPDDLLVAALNEPQYGNAELCGACAEVQGPKGSVTVRIVDRCPECKEGDLDMSLQAFERIADKSAGRVPITWTLVSCSVRGPIVYKFKEGSNPYWIALQVRNHKLPIEKLEWQKGGSWVALNRERYNYFLPAEASGPLRVRVTARGGAVLEDELPAVQEGAVVEGKAQFP